MAAERVWIVADLGENKNGSSKTLRGPKVLVIQARKSSTAPDIIPLPLAVYSQPGGHSGYWGKLVMISRQRTHDFVGNQPAVDRF